VGLGSPAYLNLISIYVMAILVYHSVFYEGFAKLFEMQDYLYENILKFGEKKYLWAPKVDLCRDLSKKKIII
jgi:hypothetical protein